MLEMRAGYRDADGALPRSTPSGDTLMHLFSIPDARLPAHDPRRRRRWSRDARRSRCSAPDWSRRFRTRRCSRSRIRPTAMATASAGAPRSSSTSPPENAGSAASDGRRSTRRCSRSAPTPIATRWASPTTSSRPSRASASRAEQIRRCDPLPDPEDVRDPATGRRGIDNFEAFMKFLAPVAARRHCRRRRVTASASSPPSVARACHVPALTTGPSANPLFNRVSRAAVLRSAVARCRHRRRHRAGRGAAGGDPDAGAVGSATAPSAAPRRQRGDDRRRDPQSSGRGRTGPAWFRRLSPDEQARVLLFLRSL